MLHLHKTMPQRSKRKLHNSKQLNLNKHNKQLHKSQLVLVLG